MDKTQDWFEKNNIHDPINISEKDNIESRDILGRRYLAERIARRLAEADCPSVVGVYGGWGTGKTSLINLLKDYNKRSNGSNIHIVEIDAWKFESDSGLLIPIVVKLRRLSGDEDLTGVWRVIAKRASITATLTISNALLGPFGASPGEVLDLYDKVSSKDDPNSYLSILQRWEQQSNEIEETEKAFEKVVGITVNKLGGKRIVICIDNLDRCSPENVVRLLESVKVFFNAPGCVWLFAMDSDVVAGYINKKYQGTGVDGYSYLDKIIPEQYHLSLSPASDEMVISALLRYAVGDGYYQIDISKIPQIPKLLVPRRLIKSARKVADYYKSRFATRGVPTEIVIGLSFLYHTWPGFYQRLSSSSKKHIRGMLDNFFDLEAGLSSKKDSQQENIPLSEGFLQDKELVYFIQTVFSGYNTASSEKYINEILNGLEGLREGGLP